MALQTKYSMKPNGFDKEAVIDSAYCRVDNVQGNKDELTVSVAILNGDVYAASFSSKFVPSVENNSKNFIAQAYEHLKKLPEFEKATDC